MSSQQSTKPVAAQSYPELDYPWQQLPEAGEWIAVAEGVYWLRMALPMKLDHINLYVIEDEAGWWIVDTGMKWGDTQDRWRALFDGPMSGKPVVGVIATHMHPDHIGQAGWLCDHWKAPFYTSFGEYYNARTLYAMRREMSWTAELYFRRAGLVDADFAAMKSGSGGGIAAIMEPLPESFVRLSAGDTVAVGGRQWEVVIASGHSPEHVCLFSRRDEILLAGDQVIPRITSNISVMPSEPEDNPLARWFDSLRDLMALPENTLVLPAHNEPFRGLRPRLQFLVDHHERHLQTLEQACIEPKTVKELLPLLFTRKIESSQMVLALGECLAHLNYLMSVNRMSRIAGEGDVWLYQSSNAHPVHHDTPVIHSFDPPMEV